MATVTICSDYGAQENKITSQVRLQKWYFALYMGTVQGKLVFLCWMLLEGKCLSNFRVFILIFYSAYI